jgi:DNA adenine methylase
MQPFVKWPGGKQEELKIITPNLPSTINRYIEPFVGGGAVYISISDAKAYLINDKSEELMGLYECIKDQNDDFLMNLHQINYNWCLIEKIVDKHSKELLAIFDAFRQGNIRLNEIDQNIDSFVEKYVDEFNGLLKEDFNIDLHHFIHEIKKSLKNKMKRMRRIEIDSFCLAEEDTLSNIESAFKSGIYTHFRYIYNNAKKYRIDRFFKLALFYFLREFCYSSMFRYSINGDFNVPYGGISYNRKNFGQKLKRLSDPDLVNRLNKTTIMCDDFEEFLNKIQLKVGDFIFLDPPYDTDFSTYAKNTFDQNDQIRLANYLKNTKANFMLVIKNTDFIYELYKDFNIVSFDKKYTVSFRNRNNKDVEHLIITNYDNNGGITNE